MIEKNKTISGIVAGLWFCIFGIAGILHGNTVWDVEYNGGILPEQAIPGAKLFGLQELRSMENGALHINDNRKNALSHYLIPWGASNSAGFTVEVKLKVVSATPDAGVCLSMTDGKNGGGIAFCRDFISAAGARYQMNAADDFHLYRFTARENNFKVYADGKPVINGTGKYNPLSLECWKEIQNALRFGAITTGGTGESYWQSLRYTVRGAFAPDGSPEVFTAEPVAETPLPKLGSQVSAQVLCENADFTLWLEPTTRKVMQHDFPKPTKISRDISISACKNEYEVFQLVISPKSNAGNLSLSFSDLQGKSGIIKKECFKYNPVGYIRIEKPSMTGPCLYEEKGGPGYWPDPLLEKATVNITERRNYPIWITVKVPKDITAGLYEGTITLHRDDAALVKIPLKLNVWNFSLPDDFHIRAVAHCTAIESETVRNNPELLMSFYRNFAEHHFSTDEILPEPKIRLKDGDFDIDFSEFDKTADYCIETLKMQMFFLPGLKGQGIYFIAGQNNNAYVGGKWQNTVISTAPGTITKEFAELFGKYIKKISAHLKEKGWLDKVYIEVMDEPSSLNDYRFIKEISSVIKAANPDLKVWVCMDEPDDLIWKTVDVWCMGHPVPQLMDRWTASGKTLAWYPNWFVFIDRPGMNTRIVGWVMWQKKIKNMLAFETTFSWSAATWNSPKFVYGDGKTVLWGNGLLLYPGEGWRPANSVRWETYRESLEDYEYLYLLNDCISRADSRKNLLTASQRSLLNEASEFLKNVSLEMVPAFETYRAKGMETKEIYEAPSHAGKMAWELDENKVYQARQKIACYIEKLSAITVDGGRK